MIHVYGFSKAQDPEFDFHEVCSQISYISLILWQSYSSVLNSISLEIYLPSSFSVIILMQRIRIALKEMAVDVEMRRVRVVAPGKWMLCASFVLPETVAFVDSKLDV
jgi:tRNA (guanine37-N1)-methyltransferase